MNSSQCSKWAHFLFQIYIWSGLTWSRRDFEENQPSENMRVSRGVVCKFGSLTMLEENRIGKYWRVFHSYIQYICSFCAQPNGHKAHQWVFGSMKWLFVFFILTMVEDSIVLDRPPPSFCWVCKTPSFSSGEQTTLLRQSFKAVCSDNAVNPRKMRLVV